MSESRAPFVTANGIAIDPTLDTEGLRVRYGKEREKRLRTDGTDQYFGTTDRFAAQLEIDPARDAPPREAIEERIDVAIIGGGLCGILLAVRLREAGIGTIRIIEKGSDFGGTWYWNTYPGLACDIESYVYIPLLEEMGYVPTEKYARGAEIFDHIQKICAKYRLYERGMLNTLANGMTWDAMEGRWIVTTDRGDVLHARFAITAGGLLHKPKLPDVPGLETFQGRWFHTSRWDYGYTGGSAYGELDKLRDKRVGIIGTGATAIQCIPYLGEDAQHLTVFQRTPSSIDVRANRPTDPEWAAALAPGWQAERMKNFNDIVNGRDQAVDMVADAWTENFRMLFAGIQSETDPVRQAEIRQLADFTKMERIRARVDSIVTDDATAQALKPYYNLFCKRPGFHDSYLQTFNRDNVTLVDTLGRGVERITPDGIVVGGQEYALDCIVFATGFEFELSVDYTRRLGFDVKGRDGATLSEAWREGTMTMHGMHAHGFPNYFICSIMQAGLPPSITHLLNEQALHVAYIVRHCLDRDIDTVEVTKAAQDDWVATIIAMGEGQRQMNRECTPGYVNNEGREDLASMRNALFGGGSARFFEILAEWREAGGLPGMTIGRRMSSISAGDSDRMVAVTPD